jgi:hypothetical protein
MIDTTKIRCITINEKLPVDMKTQTQFNWLVWMEFEPIEHRDTVENDCNLYSQARRRLQDIQKKFRKLIAPEQIATGCLFLEFTK